MSDATASAVRPIPASTGGTEARRRDISLKLSVIARRLRRRLDRSLDEVGITRAQWTVIAVVARRPGATQRVIAETLEVSDAAAGRLIDRLCADGLLERRARADDRRAYSIVLAEGATPIIARMSTIAADDEARMFAGFDDADLARLGGLLDALYTGMND